MRKNTYEAAKAAESPIYGEEIRIDNGKNLDWQE